MHVKKMCRYLMTIIIFSIAAINSQTYSMEKEIHKLTLQEVNQHNEKSVRYFLSKPPDETLLDNEPPNKIMLIGKRNKEIVSFVRIQIPIYDYILLHIQIDDLFYKKDTTKLIKKKFIELLIAKLFTIDRKTIIIEASFNTTDNVTDQNMDTYQFTNNGFKLYRSKLCSILYYKLY